MMRGNQQDGFSLIKKTMNYIPKKTTVASSIIFKYVKLKI